MSANPQQETKVVKFWFARHGERQAFDGQNTWSYEVVNQAANTNPRVWWDDPLTQRGLLQAQELGKQLPALKRIFTSPFVRCFETALAVAQQQQLSGITLDRSLCEYLCKEWFDRVPFDEIMLNAEQLREYITTATGPQDKKWKSDLTINAADELNVVLTDYETYHSMQLRAVAICKKLIKSPSQFDNCLFVTHGGVVHAIMDYFRSLSNNASTIQEGRATYCAFSCVELHVPSSPATTVSIGRVLESPFQRTQTWARGQFPNWKQWFVDSKTTRLSSSPEQEALSILEIGSWEGLSMSWFVTNLLTHHQESCIYCVDHFDGMKAQGKQRYDKFTFNQALTGHPDKVHIFPYFSYIALTQHIIPSLKRFDLIYVDADHTSKGVLEDAILSWKLLKLNGLMLFDDYEWPIRSDENPHNPLTKQHPEHPKPGIDAFLQVYQHEMEVLHVGYQVLVRKTVDSGFNFPTTSTE